MKNQKDGQVEQREMVNPPVGRGHGAAPYNSRRLTDMLVERFYASTENRDHKRRRRATWLRRKRGSGCFHLAEKLDACRRNRRCHSPACPECAAAAQRLIASAVRRAVQRLKLPADADIVCLSVVPADGLVRLGNLSKSDQELAIRRWKDRLLKAGVRWFVGRWTTASTKTATAKSGGVFICSGSRRRTIRAC
jgi:hypothetical protein